MIPQSPALLYGTKLLLPADVEEEVTSAKTTPSDNTSLTIDESVKVKKFSLVGYRHKDLLLSIILIYNLEIPLRIISDTHDHSLEQFFCVYWFDHS